ncbi:MAG: methionyl-tRNA formyltransferase [Solirubrobacterales bacterium]
MTCVYLGTSEFAAAVLRRLAAGEDRPALVVTPPDRRRGRGRRLAPPPAASTATELGIELLQTENVNDPAALERLLAAAPEVGVVCAFGQLIREPLLSELELLNVHPSLLPRWRGAAPIERAIAAGDRETGVTIMRVDAGLDSGPVALQESVAIGDDDYGALAGRLEELSGRLIVRALGLRRRGALELTAQDESQATYAEKIAPAERRLDPARGATELARMVRALTPHIGAYLELARGGRLGVRRARAEPGSALGVGEVEGAGGLRVGCADGALRLEVVQPPGGRPMDALDYLRGHPAPQLEA